MRCTRFSFALDWHRTRAGGVERPALRVTFFHVWCCALSPEAAVAKARPLYSRPGSRLRSALWARPRAVGRGKTEHALPPPRIESRTLPPISPLAADVEPLRAWFNTRSRRPRLIAILSAT